MSELDVDTHLLQSPEWPLSPETGVQIGVAHIPRKCIGHIELHDDLSLIEDGFETTEGVSAWIENNVVISVPPYRSNKSYWTNFYHGRVIPLEYGRYKYRGISGTVISQKGGFLSGLLYADKNRAIEFPERYIKGLETTANDDKDNKISTKLIHNGFRSALGFGRILLDYEKTREFLLKEWSREQYALDIIDAAFSDVEKHKHQLTIPLRIGGTLSRIDHDPLVDGFTSMDTHAFRANEISAGAAVFSDELASGGALYGTLAVSQLVDIKKAIKALDHLAFGPRYFGIVDLHIYRDLLACMFGQNLCSLQKAQWDYSGPSVKPNGDLGLPKDTDHAGVHYDYNFSWQPSDQHRYPAEIITDQYLKNAVDDMEHMLLYATYFPQFLQFTETKSYLDIHSIREEILKAAHQIGFQPY
jgi:hypothetical protein